MPTERFSIPTRIVLPKDNPELRETLVGKLQEYQERLVQREAEVPPVDYEIRDTRYKILVLSLLLETGEVRIDDVFERLPKEPEHEIEKIGHVIVRQINNAMYVINQYVQHNHRPDVYGGTGLPGDANKKSWWSLRG